MKKFIFIMLILINIGIVSTAYADIVVNEIAWKGMSSVRTTDEWIELYNNGNEEISLDDKSLLVESGPTPKLVELVGVLEPKEYFLICKKQIDDIPCDIKDAVFTLSNSAMTNIILKKGDIIISTGTITSSLIQENGSGKYYSGQRTDNNKWIVATPTPGAKNKQELSSTGSGNTSGTDDDLDDDEILLDSDTKIENKEDLIKEIVINPEYAAKMILPEVFVQQVPTTFDTEVKYRKVITKLKGKFEWSMGDGGYYLSHESKPFPYTYQEPGEYVISMRYYSSIFNEEPDTLHQKTITVLPAKTELIRKSNGTVSITNGTSGTLDLGEWKLIHKNQIFTIPKFTLVKSGSTISIPQRVHNFANDSISVSLYTPALHFSSSELKPVNNYNKSILTTNISEKLENTDILDPILYQPAVEQVNLKELSHNRKTNYWIFIFIGIIFGSVVIQVLNFIKNDIQEDKDGEI